MRKSMIPGEKRSIWVSVNIFQEGGAPFLSWEKQYEIRGDLGPTLLATVGTWL